MPCLFINRTVVGGDWASRGKLHGWCKDGQPDTDRENQLKMVIRGVQIIPKCVFLDPELLSSIPPKIAAETGADALTHNLLRQKNGLLTSMQII